MAYAEVEYRCYVGGLNWATDEQALERAFSPYGEILGSKIINDRETGRSRGFGFVTFSNEQSMRDAIEGMNGQDLDGRNITVNEAQSCGGGGGGYSRGGGGGRYGGGGRRESGGGYSRGGGYGGSGRDRGYGSGGGRSRDPRNPHRSSDRSLAISPPSRGQGTAFPQVKAVEIDNVVTLIGVVSHIFDKALMEPTFCEMYADLCSHLAVELPDFNEDNEKITFKRVLLNKCQEEFERCEREQEEANKADEEGEIKQSAEEREEKRVKARRRMLGNIRFIGELYKKKVLTERIMHACITKLLGQSETPDEEDVEALCILMSSIGETIDHPKAKEHMDVYFERMKRLSTNLNLSSRVRFMLKDAIDLRKNKWQQRRKVKGPKKIDEVHRDASQERQAESSRLSRGLSINQSARRTPMDFAPRGSTLLSSPNAQLGGFRGLSTPVRGLGIQDVRLEDRQSHDTRILSVPLPQRTLGPQGGLGRGMSIRGPPSMPSTPVVDVSPGPTDFRRMAAGLNGYSSLPERTTYGTREDLVPRYIPDRFAAPAAYEPSSSQERNVSYGNGDPRNPDRSYDRSLAISPPARGQGTAFPQNVPSEKVWPEECLRDKSMAAIKEYYSAKDEKEVELCVKELDSPSFHPSMVSLWVADSLERKDIERDLLAKLMIYLSKSGDGVLSQAQLIKGFESVLTTLEDAINDAPRAPEYLSHIFAKVITENVIPLREIGLLIHKGGEEPGHLLEVGLAADVLGSTLEIIKSEKGDSVLNEIWASSTLRLEDFRPPDPYRSRKLEKVSYGNGDPRNPNRSSDRSLAISPPTRGQGTTFPQNVPSEKVWPEERLRDKSMAAIKEYYSARDEKEVELCVKELDSPSFHPSMVSLWVADSLERKDMERDLLAKLMIYLSKSGDGVLSQAQLIKGFESVLTTLEDAINDAPRAPEYLGHIFAKVITENVIPLREIGLLIHKGGEESGHLLEVGLAADVLGSTLEIIKFEKGDSVLNEIWASSTLRLEDFRPPDPYRSRKLEKVSYGNGDPRNPDRSYDRSLAISPPARGQGTSFPQNVPSEKVWPEERLRDKSMAAIKEYYSARDEKEVELCVKELDSPSFHPSMVSLWVANSLERKDMERDLLAKLMIYLSKSGDGVLSQAQLIKGFEYVLTTLEDAINDAPRAPEYLGHIFAKVITENVIPLREIGLLIHKGGEEPGHLLEVGLAADVLGSTLEIIKSEKGDSVLNEIWASSTLRLEDFRPPDPYRSRKLEKFIYGDI